MHYASKFLTVKLKYHPQVRIYLLTVKLIPSISNILKVKLIASISNLMTVKLIPSISNLLKVKLIPSMSNLLTVKLIPAGCNLLIVKLTVILSNPPTNMLTAIAGIRYFLTMKLI